MFQNNYSSMDTGQREQREGNHKITEKRFPRIEEHECPD